MTNVSKRIKNIRSILDKNKVYTLDESINFIKTCSNVKFDETVEIAINLNIDPKKQEQNVRGIVQLPNGTGKSVRIAVFAKGLLVEEAKKAGADIVGDEDLIESIQNGKIDFDKCISTPDMMASVSRIGKILGPRGLMPNPKLGTVTNDLSKSIQSIKFGQIEYKSDKGGVIHAGIGKISFPEDFLKENVIFFIDTIQKAKPSGIRNNLYIKSLFLSCTMGPGIKFLINNQK